jgi:hypothetical protein
VDAKSNVLIRNEYARKRLERMSTLSKYLEAPMKYLEALIRYVKPVFDFLRAHPIALLLLLTPGIPEYLSSSSPFNALILNPGQFAFQLLLNLGLYGPGVILIREAKIRWKKGWGSVLLLGAAYGILEEGVALSTLYNPLAGPVGKLGVYGHYLGVNWVWLFGLIPFHAIFSISLPILLLGLALPETKGRSFLPSMKEIGIVFGILGADVLTLFLFVLNSEKYWMGLPIFISSFAAIGALVYIARKLPAGYLRPKSVIPTISPIMAALLGLVFFPATLLIQSILGVEAGIPPALDIVLSLAIDGLILYYLIKVIGREKNQKHLLSFGAGLLAPIAIFGLIAEIHFPLILLVDLAFGLFFWKVLQHYQSTRTTVALTARAS